MNELLKLNLSDIKAKLANKEVSVSELIEASIQHIEQSEKDIHALLATNFDNARKQASEMDKAGPDASKFLWGVPVTIKDAICVKDMPTTSASKILENFVSTYDAFVVEKLKQAGAIILAKNNMDEFAMGSTTQNSAYKITKNPHNLKLVPGGSSGGSAASIVAYQSYSSLGTDTGGSIRQPAALCGCYGLKPSYGRVSRYGVIAYASSLDQVGPFGRSAKDCAEVLQVIAGFDKQDSTSAQIKVPNYIEAIDKQKDLKGVKIGLVKEYMQNNDSECAFLYTATVDNFRKLGAEIVDLSFKFVDEAVAAYYILATAEASSNLARFDGVRYGHRSENFSKLDELYANSRSEGFGKEVQRRIMLGTFVLSAGYYDAYYKKAAEVRQLVRKEYYEAFDKCDFILAPVSPRVAWEIGSTMTPIESYRVDTFTLGVNLAGLPACAFPVGLNGAKLPVGMQLIGKAFAEDSLLAAISILNK